MGPSCYFWLLSCSWLHPSPRTSAYSRSLRMPAICQPVARGFSILSPSPGWARAEDASRQTTSQCSPGSLPPASSRSPTSTQSQSSPFPLSIFSVHLLLWTSMAATTSRTPPGLSWVPAPASSSPPCSQGGHPPVHNKPCPCPAPNSSHS